MNGIYFYKLQSPYPNDATKNCKLTINEIDSNFLFLEDKDIKECAFDRDSKLLVLTRNNGERLVADLSDVTYNLDVVYDNGCGTDKGGTITISYDCVNGPQTVVIDKLVTTDNLKSIIGHDVLTKVITDDTMRGNGTLDAPLTLNKAYLPGSYAPVTSVVDTTKGEHLPEKGAYGSRYLTKEAVSDFGYLYNFDAVELIQKHMAERAVPGKEEYCWHVPTKAEWDKLLNSVEPCKFKNHESADCHVELGKNAGRILKSACGWLEQTECECDGSVPLTTDSCTIEPDDAVDFDFIEGEIENPTNPPYRYIGTDEIGFRVYPVGVAYNDEYNRPMAKFFKAKSTFWTTSHVNGVPTQDIYVKEFNYNQATVRQEAECPAAYYSVRLVKDYNGSNYYGSEVINGITYETLLVPETSQIWLISNVAYSDGTLEGLKKDVNYTTVNGNQTTEGRAMFFINSWNGTTWDRKALANGDTVVVNDCNENMQYNAEYRVYMDEQCNAVLVNTDDLVVERVLDEVIPLIEKERDARISGDTILNQKIESEKNDRENADNNLWKAINDEREKRKHHDQVLDAEVFKIKKLNEKQEIEIINLSAATEDLADKLAEETASREAKDNELLEAILNEVSARTDADDALSQAIQKETEDRIAADTELAEKIENLSGESADLADKLDKEIQRATDAENTINDQLVDNTDPYVLKVTEGVVLKSKDGLDEHSIIIQFDGNYGEF